MRAYVPAHKLGHGGCCIACPCVGLCRPWAPIGLCPTCGSLARGLVQDLLWALNIFLGFSSSWSLLWAPCGLNSRCFAKEVPDNRCYYSNHLRLSVKTNFLDHKLVDLMYNLHWWGHIITILNIYIIVISQTL